MKNKYLFTLAICFLVSLVFLMANQGQNPQWKGTIEEEDGVKVIKNPREPLYGEITFDLEEDLSIGNEEDENYAFYSIVQVYADSEGNVYVLDRKNCRIQKFDKNGNYLQTIGRKGQGPGEFESPWGICFDSQQNIYVYEIRNIDVFNSDGRYTRTIVPKEPFAPIFGITKNGNIMAQTSSRSREERTDGVAIFDGEGKKIKTIVDYKSEAASVGKGFDLGSIYTPGLWFYPINEELAIYGYSSEYKLFVIDSSGELVHIIEKNEPPTSLSKKEINKIYDDWMERLNQRRTTGRKYSKSEIKKSSNFPKHIAFFTGFTIDDKCRIYVSKFKSRLDEYKGGYFDIFSKDGYYLYRAKISPYPRVIKNGCIYTREYDQDTGYSKIKRYKIKNWEQIKEGVR